MDARLAMGDLFLDWEQIGATGVRYVLSRAAMYRPVASALNTS